MFPTLQAGGHYQSEKRSYFANIQFNDPGVRELVSGIDAIVLNPQADFQLREQILQRLAGVIGRAVQYKFISGGDYKPRWFKSKAYEGYLRKSLGDINRELKLGIRV